MSKSRTPAYRPALTMRRFMGSLHPAATGRIGTMNPDASGKFPHGKGDHGGGRARDLLFSVVVLSVGKPSASVGLVHGEAN